MALCLTWRSHHDRKYSAIILSLFQLHLTGGPSKSLQRLLVTDTFVSDPALFLCRLIVTSKGQDVCAFLFFCRWTPLVVKRLLALAFSSEKISLNHHPIDTDSFLHSVFMFRCSTWFWTPKTKRKYRNFKLFCTAYIYNIEENAASKVEQVFGLKI